MSEIRKWREEIGVGQYAYAFDANEIGMDLLGQVDDQTQNHARNTSPESHSAQQARTDRCLCDRP